MPNIQHADLTSIHPFAYTGADPGAVGANKGWVDTTATPYKFYIRNDSNTDWVQVSSSASSGGSIGPEFNILNYGAVGDGSHDDTASIQAAIDAAGANGTGTVIIPQPTSYWRCDGQLVIDSLLSLRIAGCGGDDAETHEPVCPVVYTGTASKFVKAKETVGLTVERVDWRYSNTGFTGDLWNLCPDSGDLNVTYNSRFVGNTFSSYGAAKLAGAGTARSGINLAGSVETIIENNIFTHLNYGVIGKTSTDSRLFATAVTFKDNRYAYLNIAGIANHDDAWLVIGDTFEFLYPGTGSTGVAGAYVDTVETTSAPASLIHFIRCGFWDTGSEGGTWIKTLGYGVVAQDCFVQLGSAAVFIEATAPCDTVVVQSCEMKASPGTAVAINATVGTIPNVILDDTNLIDINITRISGSVVQSNQFRQTIGFVFTGTGNSGGTLSSLATIITPPHIISRTNEELYLHAIGTFAANSDSDKQIVLDLGGTIYFDSGLLSTNGGSWEFIAEIIQTGTNAQKAYFQFRYSPAPTGVVGTSSTVLTLFQEYTFDFSSAYPWLIKGKGTTTNDVVCKSFQIYRQRL